MHESGSAKFQKQHFDSTYSDDVPSQSLEQMKTPPGRPTAQKPIFKPTQKSYTLDANQAIALYTFQACQDGDLGKFILDQHIYIFSALTDEGRV
jgi:hypothetical protein